jgi:hypothetical protein
MAMKGKYHRHELPFQNLWHMHQRLPVDSINTPLPPLPWLGSETACDDETEDREQQELGHSL